MEWLIVFFDASWFIIENGDESGGWSGTLECAASANHLIDHASKREHIGGGGEGLATDLSVRHVAYGSCNQVRSRNGGSQRIRFTTFSKFELSKPEVENFERFLRLVKKMFSELHIAVTMVPAP